MPRKPEQPTLPVPSSKPLTVPERAAIDHARHYGKVCRDKNGDLFYVVGWGMASGHTGHVVRLFLPDESRFGLPHTMITSDLLALEPTDEPGPAPEEKT